MVVDGSAGFGCFLWFLVVLVVWEVADRAPWGIPTAICLMLPLAVCPAIAFWAPGETQKARITYPFSPGETQKARFYPLTPATAGRGSCDGPLGPRRNPKGKNHISVLSRRDPKGKVPPGGVVAIAFWAPGETQKARITYPLSPGETQKAKFRRGG